MSFEKYRMPISAASLVLRPFSFSPTSLNENTWFSGTISPSCYPPDVVRPILRQVVVIEGIQTGDEGKGRAVYDIANIIRRGFRGVNGVKCVIKNNGGANSGHEAYGLKHNLIPGGIKDPEIEFLGIGAGVVADPLKYRWEIRPLENLGLPIREKLFLDRKVMLSDFTDRLLDLANELWRTKTFGEGRGSTGRGISPAYGHEVSQEQIYYYQFVSGDKELFRRNLTTRMTLACSRIQHEYGLTHDEWLGLFSTLTGRELDANKDAIKAGLFKESDFDFARFLPPESHALNGKATDSPKEPKFTLNFDQIVDEYWAAGKELAGNIQNVRHMVRDVVIAGGFVVVEGGQSVLLDKREGYSPSTTSSHTDAAEVYQSCGVPVSCDLHVVGVVKAYETKVGNHVFPTQLPEGHPLFEVLKDIERGTSTGRQRSIGWHDAVSVGSVIARKGINDLIINKLDVLTYNGYWQGLLKICVAYKEVDDNEEIVGVHFELPDSIEAYKRMRPVFVEMEGWMEDISQVRSWSDLPENAKKYAAAIAAFDTLLSVKGECAPLNSLPNVRFIGVGKDPEQIITDIPSTENLLAMTDVRIEGQDLNEEIIEKIRNRLNGVN